LARKIDCLEEIINKIRAINGEKKSLIVCILIPEAMVSILIGTRGS
jgi:hypothetical protein